MRNRKFVAWLLTFAVIIALLAPIGSVSAADTRQQSNPISAGTVHTLAIKKDGTIMAWGSNKDYQLGLSSEITEAATPTLIEGFTAVSVAAGYSFSVALQQSGLVYVWGGGKEQYPRLVQGLTNVVAIAASDDHVLVLRADGTVWQWKADEGTPAKVPGLESIAAIAAGGAHFLALTYSGEIWAWGNNAFGQLGIGSTYNRERPAKIEGFIGINAICAGFSHSLAINDKGKVFAWGNNSYGELGNTSKEISLSPREVKQITNAVQISAGNAFSMALTSDNRLYTWGYGEYGQLGQGGGAISIETPGTVNTSSKLANVGAGMSHAYYIDNSGYLYIWGRNNNHQLGTGQAANENTPKRLFNGLAESQGYSTNIFGGCSDWAEAELTTLHSMNLAPRLLWANYKENITRAELAYLLVTLYEQILKTKVSVNDKNSFKDAVGHLLEDSIRKANALNIINGISSSQFDPDANTTREQAAKMISVFVEKTKKSNMEFDYFGPLPYYKDEYQIGYWAIPFVAYAYDNGIMQGSDNQFNPRGLLTREQALLMICRTVIQFGWGK